VLTLQRRTLQFFSTLTTSWLDNPKNSDEFFSSLTPSRFDNSENLAVLLVVVCSGCRKQPFEKTQIVLKVGFSIIILWPGDLRTLAGELQRDFRFTRHPSGTSAGGLCRRGWHAQLHCSGTPVRRRAGERYNTSRPPLYRRSKNPRKHGRSLINLKKK
jgi:hypothetical protein